MRLFNWHDMEQEQSLDMSNQELLQVDRMLVYDHIYALLVTTATQSSAASAGVQAGEEIVKVISD